MPWYMVYIILCNLAQPPTRIPGVGRALMARGARGFLGTIPGQACPAALCAVGSGHKI